MCSSRRSDRSRWLEAATLFGVMAAAVAGLRGALDASSSVWMGSSIELMAALSLLPLLLTVALSADRRAWWGAAVLTASVPGLLVCVHLIAHALRRSQRGGDHRASALRYSFELLRELSTDLWYGAGLISVVTLIAIAGARLSGGPLSTRGVAFTGLAALPLALSLVIQPMVPIGAVALVAATLALPLAPDRVRLAASAWLAAAVATAWAASHPLTASADLVADPDFLSAPETRVRILEPIIVRPVIVGVGGLVAAMLPVVAAWWMQRRTPSTRVVRASIGTALALGAGTVALAGALA